MKLKTLTDAELLVLGLVAEMPRHGYELEQAIEKRAMREWTEIGFSSIYFVLGKLEKMALVAAETQTGPKTRKVFSVTKLGLKVLVEQSSTALGSFRMTYSSAMMGMLHWPLMKHVQGIEALQQRSKAVKTELERIEAIRFEQQPLPDYVETLFEFSIDQLKAELLWIERTLNYMRNRPS